MFHHGGVVIRTNIIKLKTYSVVNKYDIREKILDRQTLR